MATDGKSWRGGEHRTAAGRARLALAVSKGASPRKAAKTRPRCPDATEAQIQRAVVHYLTLRKIIFTQTDAERSWNKSGSVRFKRRITPGWPDITLVIGGRAVFAEVKTRTGKLSAVQRECHERLTNAGGIVWVVRSIEDVKAMIDDVNNPTIDGPETGE